MWNRLLGSNKQVPMGLVVGDRLGWLADDPRRDFVTHTWIATINVVNVPLHPEGRSTAHEFSTAETKLIFRQVALLSEFLGSLSN